MAGLINSSRKGLPARESEPEPLSTYSGNKHGQKESAPVTPGADATVAPKVKPKITTVRVTVDTQAQLNFLVGANKTKTVDDVIAMLLNTYVDSEMNDTEKKLFDLHMEMQRERMNQ